MGYRESITAGKLKRRFAVHEKTVTKTAGPNYTQPQ